MKKLYLITAKDYDYDEYDSVLIRAKDKEEAEKELLVFLNHYNNQNPLENFNGYDIEEILQDGENGVIIASFNAG